MILSLSSAATGMEAQQLNLNNISNNLANVSTTGYKRSKIEFQDLLYQQQRTAGADVSDNNVLPAGVELGNGSRVVSTAKVFTQGQVKETDSKLDIALQGDGFLEVQMPDGTKAYTRDGGLKMSADGRVMTNSGLPVLSGFQPIQVGATDVAISSSGQVTVTTAKGKQNFQIELTRFNNPAGLTSLGGNLYGETPASGTPQTGKPGDDGMATIQQGYVETSNVNVAEEMVNMIMAQRAYEVNSKSIQSSDEMLQTVNQLKR